VSWRPTGVYDPQGDLEKNMFLRELKRIKPVSQDRWLIIGDFNMVYQAQDKNNTRLNQSLMPRFRRTLNYLEVKEIDLVGRRFTWSNNQASPTLTHIERPFCSSSWEEVYANPILNPVSSSTSDHCPLILMPLFVPSRKPKFRLESFWPQLSGFLDCVHGAWSKPVPSKQKPLGKLHIKLSRVAKVLKKWHMALIP
jgi:hypothetical protein